MRNVAIILAGGTGSRVGESCPKQFIKICGRTVVEHSVDAFERCDVIDEIAVVMHPMWVDKMNEIAESNKWTKLRKVLCGGKERYMSTVAAIEAYRGKGECNMIFHDAARPLVGGRIIREVAEMLERCEAVGVAIPVTDTVFVAENGTISSVPDRNKLFRAQTPQAFKLSVINRAYEIALQDEHFRSTDDCGTVMRYLPDIDIHLIEGEEKNMKLTYPEDVEIAERWLGKKNEVDEQ